MKKLTTSNHRPFELLCCWICITSFSLSDAESLKGQKVEYRGTMGKYVDLINYYIKEITQFTVCIDLYRTTNSPSWTVFSYDVHETERLDLAFAGVENKLILYHFDSYSSFGDDLVLSVWHSVCCTWNGSELSVYVNGSSIFNKTYPVHYLKANGSLVLGYNHTNMGHNITLHSSTNFLGSLYYFQMWDYVKLPKALNDCSEGNIISWKTEFWEFHKIAPTEDRSLRCGEVYSTASASSVALSSPATPTERTTENETNESTSGHAATTVLQSAETTTELRPASTQRPTLNTVPSQPVTTLTAVGTNTMTTDLTSLPTFTNTPHSIMTTLRVLETTPTSTLISTGPPMTGTAKTPKPTPTALPNLTTKTTPQAILPLSSQPASTVSQVTINTPSTSPTSSTAKQTEESSHPNKSTSTAKAAASATTLEANSKETQKTSASLSAQPSTPQTSFTTLGTQSTQASLFTTEAPDNVTFYIIRMNLTFQNTNGGGLIEENLLLYLTAKLLGNIFKNTEFEVLQFAVTKDGESRINTSSTVRNGLNKLSSRSTTLKEHISATCCYNAKAILQATSPDTQNEVIIRIQELSQNRNYSESSLKILIESVTVTYLDPGDCPLQITSSNAKGNYTWKKTGPVKRAVALCEKNVKQYATRECYISITTDTADWKSPNLRKCKLIHPLPNTIIDLRDLRITSENAEDVAEHILALSLNKHTLSKEETEVVINKSSEIIQLGEIDISFGQTALQIISALVEKADNVRQFTNRILIMMEKLGDKITFTGPTANITATALALAVTGVDLTAFQGVFFSVTSYLEGMEPEILMHDSPFNKTVDFIFLPGTLQNHMSPIISRIQFNFFGTTSLFKEAEGVSDVTLNTYVVGASVANNRIQNLNDPVIVTLKHIATNTHNEPVQCVFWDFTKNDRLGGWNTSGCDLVFTDANHTTCHCSHLTHFGVLMDLSGTKIDPVNERILTLITYVGCGTSSIFLGVALITYLAFVQLRKDNPSKILMNLCAALLLLNLTFLLNTWMSSFNIYGLCISAAVLLHYFLLVSFTWMGLEAVHMYFALVKVFNVYVPNYILKFCIAGWGIPAIIVITVVSVNRDFYGITEDVSKELSSSTVDSVSFCWIQDSLVFYISVVAYFSIIFLMNISMFIVVLLQINSLKSKQQKSMKTILHDLKSTTSLTFLLGLTWGFSFFAWGPVRIAFLYLFAIANTLQGFFIFLFHCMMKENVRKQWRIHLCCGRFRLDNSSDWSKLGNSGSRHINPAQNHKSSSQSSQSLKFTSSNSVANGSSFTSDDNPAKILTKDWSRLANAGPKHNYLVRNQKSSLEYLQSRKSRSSHSFCNGSSMASDDTSTKNLTNGVTYDHPCCVPPLNYVTILSGTRRMQSRLELEMNRTNTFWD